MEENGTKRVGLFIDCENVPCKYLNDILNIASDYGELFIRNAYGNWITKNGDDELEIKMQEWKKQCDQHGIITQSPIYTSRKNSSDIKMAIDIIKIAYAHNVLDIIVIVSSDSDFSSVANEVRLSGTRVVGIGIKEMTNPQYVKYFNNFYYLGSKQENIDESENILTDQEIPKKEKSTKERVRNAKEQKNNKTSNAQNEQLRKIVDSLINDSETKEAYQSLIVGKMKKIYNDFTRKNIGETSYENIIRKMLPETYGSKMLDDNTTIVWFKKKDK